MKRTGTLAMCRLDNNRYWKKVFTTIKAMISPANWYTASDVSVNLVSNISTITSSHWIPFRKVSSLTLRKILSTHYKFAATRWKTMIMMSLRMNPESE